MSIISQCIFLCDVDFILFFPYTILMVYYTKHIYIYIEGPQPKNAVFHYNTYREIKKKKEMNPKIAGCL